MSYCKIAPDHPVHGPYHDREYGFPAHDEAALFERLVLEINQAGLSWLTILSKRENFRAAFDYFDIDKVAAYGSAGIFAATGLLALLAPSPLDQPTRLSSATVHKTCMAVATAGMVAQVALGIVAASKEGRLSQRDYALAHQIIGYTTAVATAGGFIAITW